MLPHLGRHVFVGALDAAAQARVTRSRIVRQAGHLFLFIVEEAVLRYQLGGKEAMAGLLGRLFHMYDGPSRHNERRPLACLEVPEAVSLGHRRACRCES
ncbi:Scr1 family TA system antitoxin-like transcriptional regulator [Streptomyces boluensis]|uniref:DUF5753 domain-containing protein n=1 Tax=Streptomyces boluensis TaxID=1775135 RepID=A0A964UUA9_9ACTN|nr:Scr1 family TA system antitoxin-like transcriptional regulator [Streptomyces boluensis]NBE53057.1 hypothetical protein [Streptomyces boluensis]